MPTGDFSQKLGVVLKAINLSRGRLAQTVGVDKSVVSRWASGVQVPSDHNLSLLTEAVARHRPGFDRRDWELCPEALAARLAGPAAATAPERPSIAVLPFRNLSGDPEQDYFADGLSTEIIAALSRFKLLFVLAGESSFTFKGKPINVRQIAKALGVRYLLDGSVQRAGSRIRIAAHLIECPEGAHLWADHFEGAMADVFDLQDRVAAGVVGAMMPALNQAEMMHARHKPSGNPTAWDCFWRGLALMRPPTREGVTEAMRLFYRATELEPNFITPWGFIGLGFTVLRNKGWATASTEEEEAEVRQLARIVADRGSEDAVALCTAGYALLFTCGEIETGAAMIDRGLALNSNYAGGWRLRGWASAMQGRYEAALEQFAHALALNPLDPQNFNTERGMAGALCNLGRYDEAVTWADRALAHDPNDVATLRVAAAVNALAGRIDEARRIMTNLLRMHPGMRLSLLPARVTGVYRPDAHALFMEGLRLAGMPE
jgi:TolB-like protein/Tfp pilus assembly protein PilF